jgi:hypothetical protein
MLNEDSIPHLEPPYDFQTDLGLVKVLETHECGIQYLLKYRGRPARQTSWQVGV